MAKPTPKVKTPDGRVMPLSRVHCAKYDRERHIPLFRRLLRAEQQRRPGQTLRVLDPMAGVGGIHAIAMEGVETIANELEQPWVDVARELWPDDLTICGDAAALNVDDSSFDAVIVSPDFGSRFCMPAGTLVMTAMGYRPIDAVVPGEMVLTHRNRWRRVTWSGCTGERNLVKVRGQGAGELLLTDNHPVWSRWNSCSWDPRPEESSPGWVSAGALGRQGTRHQRYFWATPASPAEAMEHPAAPEGFEYSDAFWWSVGFWLAQGWGYRTVMPNGTWRRAYVGWCHGTYRTDGSQHARLVEAFGERCAETRDSSSVVKWHVYSQALLAWLYLHFGHLAHGKNLPGWCLALPENWRAEILNGYLEGDGHPNTHGHDVKTVGSVSRPLLRGMQLVAHGLGRSTSFAHAKSAGVEMVAGHPCPVREAWQMRVSDGGQSKFAHHIDGLDWFAIRSVSNVDGEPVLVYDIEVDEDHSFVAEGVIVHNSDHHHNKDSHKLCKGEGCDDCAHTGISPRRGYTHDLRNFMADPDYQLDSRSSARYTAKSTKYWDRQESYWVEARRVLKPEGLMVVDVKDVVMGGKVIPVVALHRRILESLGFAVEAEMPLPSVGLRVGTNSELRVDGHTVLVARKPAAEAEAAA